MYAARFTIIKSPESNVFAIEDVGMRKAPRKNDLIKIPSRKKRIRYLIIFFIRLIAALSI